jgi:hypothetical protein
MPTVAVPNEVLVVLFFHKGSLKVYRVHASQNHIVDHRHQAGNFSIIIPVLACLEQGK